MASLAGSRLPARLAPLVGRERELRDILDTLAGSRLLTLTGPGGTGKTRLALAAVDLARSSRDEVACWVGLSAISDPGVLGQTVAGRLGLAESPGQDLVETIAEQVGDQPLLLILDNCEHVTAAAGDLAERLLGACPAVRILATSREMLGVDGERSWPVPPLSLPQAGPVPDLTALASFDAIRLFEQRAQLVWPSFRLTPDNAAAVLGVCRRLDGLPLAIELAAARMRILSAAQLAERLDDVFAVLVGGARSAPPRHQTLRATLDWSHDLLGEQERAVFRRLAVFIGGFTLAAAEQVCAAGGIRGADTLDLLARLADKSLLLVSHEGADVRYRLLATVRDYAWERLADAGELDLARTAHLRCYTELAEEAGRRTDRGGQGAPGGLDRELDRLDAETPNLRAAVEFARESGDVVSALRIVGPLGRYAYLRGHYHEVRGWMDAAVTAGGAAPAGLRASALLGSGRLAFLQCDYQAAVRRLEAAVRLFRELEDSQGIAAGLQVLGSVAREQGRYVRARQLHEESLGIAERSGDQWAVASAHGYLGFVSWLQEHFAEATAECTAALAMFREIGDAEGITWSLISLAAVARYEGSASRAAALLADSLAAAEKIGFREGIGWSLELQGLLAADRGDPAAAGLLLRSLRTHHELNDRWRTASVLEDLAALALAGGRARQAARLLGAAERIRDTIGTVLPPCEAGQHTTTEAGARAALGAGAFEVACHEGAVSSLDDLQAEWPRDEAAPAPPPDPPAKTRPQRPNEAAPADDPEPAAPAPGPLRIRALGAATVHRGDVPVTAADWGYAKPRELLFLLISSPPLSRDQLGAALWPDQSPRQLGNALHAALRGLRRALGDPGWVRYADGCYTFHPAAEHECDLETFEQALAAARRARPASAALPHLQRAIAAYGGDFLDGLSAGEWALGRRGELRRAFESALLAAGRLHAAAGQDQAAASAFRRAVAQEPLNEAAHRELMACWDRLGQTARAIQHYTELAGLLQAQLAVAPAAETTALYQRLLRQR